MARGQGTQGVFKRSGTVMLAVERVTAFGKSFTDTVTKTVTNAFGR